MSDYSNLGIVFKDNNDEIKTKKNQSSTPDYSNLGITYKEDIQPSSKIPIDNSFLGALANSRLISAINAAGGTLGRGLEYAAADTVNLPLAAGNFLNKHLASLLGANPDKIPTPLEARDPGTIPMPGVSDTAQEYLDPVSHAFGDTLGFLGMGGAKGIEDTAAFGKKILDKLTGYDADTKATDFVKSLIGNQSQVKSEFNNAYENLREAANGKGYGVANNIPQKAIDVSPLAEQFANMSSINKEGFLKNLNGKTESLYNQFFSNPTYDNAHNLQSNLGKLGVKLLKNRDTAPLGSDVMGLRGAVNQGITNAFKQYGDTDLLAQRSAINNQYFQNENRLLMANKLQRAIKNYPNEGLSATANPVVNAYAKAGFKKLLGQYDPLNKTPQMDTAINSIRNSLNRQATTNWILNKLKWPAAGFGLGLGGLGLYKGEHELSDIFE